MLFLLIISLTAANAFLSSSFGGGAMMRHLKLAMSTLTEKSKYDSREALEFSYDIQSIIDKGPIPQGERQFLINGWRWHTASALRDLERYATILEKIAVACGEHKKDNTDTTTTLSSSSNILATNVTTDKTSVRVLLYQERIFQGYSFVLDYNLKALMKVESELFFPWLRRLLPPTAASLMSEIIQEQNDVRVLSAQIGQLCLTLKESMKENNNKQNQRQSDSSASSSPLNSHHPQDDVAVIRKIESKVASIRKSYEKIQSVQESIFVPYISAFIPKKEQENFNRKVISTLGMLASQVHLVGMIEAIKDQPIEMALLKAQIPSLAQVALGIWKKRLYEPKTRCLHF